LGGIHYIRSTGVPKEEIESESHLGVRPGWRLWLRGGRGREGVKGGETPRSAKNDGGESGRVSCPPPTVASPEKNLEGDGRRDLEHTREQKLRLAWALKKKESRKKVGVAGMGEEV